MEANTEPEPLGWGDIMEMEYPIDMDPNQDQISLASKRAEMPCQDVRFKDQASRRAEMPCQDVRFKDQASKRADMPSQDVRVRDQASRRAEMPSQDVRVRNKSSRRAEMPCQDVRFKDQASRRAEMPCQDVRVKDQASKRAEMPCQDVRVKDQASKRAEMPCQDVRFKDQASRRAEMPCQDVRFKDQASRRAEMPCQDVRFKDQASRRAEMPCRDVRVKGRGHSKRVAMVYHNTAYHSQVRFQKKDARAVKHPQAPKQEGGNPCGDIKIPLPVPEQLAEEVTGLNKNQVQDNSGPQQPPPQQDESSLSCTEELQTLLEQEKEKSLMLQRKLDLDNNTILLLQEELRKEVAARQELENAHREAQRKVELTSTQLDKVTLQLWDKDSRYLDLASKLKHQEEVSQALLDEVEELRKERVEKEGPSLQEVSSHEDTEGVAPKLVQVTSETIRMLPEPVEEPPKVERVSLWRRFKKALTPKGRRQYKQQRQHQE